MTTTFQVVRSVRLILTHQMPQREQPLHLGLSSRGGGNSRAVAAARARDVCAGIGFELGSEGYVLFGGCFNAVRKQPNGNGLRHNGKVDGGWGLRI